MKDAKIKKNKKKQHNTKLETEKEKKELTKMMEEKGGID